MRLIIVIIIVMSIGILIESKWGFQSSLLMVNDVAHVPTENFHAQCAQNASDQSNFQQFDVPVFTA